MFSDPKRARSRAVLVDWLLDVAEEFALRLETLFLAVDLLDRHLSCKDEETAWLQLLGTACVWTAAKMEEVFAPTSQDMINLTDQLYTTAQLVHMERHMLQTLQHAVVRPNTYTFLSALVHASNLEDLYGSPPSSRHGRDTCALCYWEGICEQWSSATVAAHTCGPAPVPGSLQQATSGEDQMDAWARSKANNNSVLSLASCLSCGTQMLDGSFSCHEMLCPAKSMSQIPAGVSSVSGFSSLPPPPMGLQQHPVHNSPSRQSSYGSLPNLLAPSPRQVHARPQVISWLLGRHVADGGSRPCSDSQLSALSDFANFGSCESPPRYASTAATVCPNAPHTFRLNPTSSDEEEMNLADGLARASHSMCCEEEDQAARGTSVRKASSEDHVLGVGGGVAGAAAALSGASGQHMQLVYLARLIAEACLMDHTTLTYPPSQVAAACLMLARAMLGKPVWSYALAQQSGIEGPQAVHACIVSVADVYAAVQQNSELVALQTRYGTRRMDVFFTAPSHDAFQLVESCRALTALAQQQCSARPSTGPTSGTAALGSSNHCPIISSTVHGQHSWSHQQHQQGFHQLPETAWQLPGGSWHAGIGAGEPSMHAVGQHYGLQMAGELMAAHSKAHDSGGNGDGSSSNKTAAASLAAQLQAFNLGQTPQSIAGTHLRNAQQDGSSSEQAQAGCVSSAFLQASRLDMWPEGAQGPHPSHGLTACDFLDASSEPVSAMPLLYTSARDTCSDSMRADHQHQHQTGACSGSGSAWPSGGMTCCSPISVLHLQGSWGAMTATSSSSLDESSNAALQLMRTCLSGGAPLGDPQL